MEAAPRPRVERKGRFTITDISPVSPAAADPPPSAFSTCDVAPIATAATAGGTTTTPSITVATTITAAADGPQTPPASPLVTVAKGQATSDASQLLMPVVDGCHAEKTPTAPLVIDGARVELEPEPSPVMTHVDTAFQHQAPPVAPAVVTTEQQETSTPVPPAPVVVVVVPTPPTLQQQPSGPENESPKSAAPVVPVTKPSLMIEVSAGSATATASPDGGSAEAARSFPSTPSHQADDERRAAERRVIRKSRFTITDLDSPVSRENSDGFFSQNYSTSSSATYSAELPQTQPLPLTEPHVAAHDALEAASSQAFSQQQQQQHFRPQSQQFGQVPFQTGEMGVQQYRPTTRSRSTPQKQRSRESRRMRMRTVSPIHMRLEMSDLVHDPSGGSSLQQTTSYTSSNGYADDLGYSGAYFSQSSSSTDYSIPTRSSMHSHGGLFSNGTMSDRRQESGSGGGGGRRSASSRQKSITVSAAQFLQQQQTIAALIRQQQELKRVVNILQEQQQQLMSVPVQLHELQIENAKGDEKDEMMRELYVQVDSLMHANDSLKVLLTQTEKEAQDRAQEVEFLTEENDQLHARCRYFERKYIEERKLTFILEEEVQRFRMVSLTHELEQRNSTSQESP